ncbi:MULTISPECIES: acyl-homoserine-lactone synthase [Streptomyces]|nr:MULTISPECIES: acyl-homoserine-lactone synthase [Streptomyces]MYV94523.1 GNAT family N-acetyltransferase [Streptomyces sp. SID1034]
MTSFAARDCTVLAGRAGEPRLSPALLEDMFRLRYEVFHRRLGWAVDVDNGLERDEFDDLDPVYAIAVHRPSKAVVGCVRVLPTTGPNMLRDVTAFHAALQGRPAPCSPHIWEASRFAIDPRVRPAPRLDPRGFQAVPRALLAAIGTYAAEHGVDQVVGLSGVTIEAKFHASGVPTTRIGDAPCHIGSVLCTAYSFAVADLVALGEPASPQGTSGQLIH